ncbi:MAG: hypothetical protein V2A73_03970 [Pseudomonadota bacterium]
MAATTMLPACGPASVTTGGDAGTSQGYELVVLEPANGQLGLAHGQSADLALRYADSTGSPIAGSLVSFGIVEDPSFPGQSSGGSSLSSPFATTSHDGIATVAALAGAANARFLVKADAHGAPTATVSVVVSDQGFATLIASPRYLGKRTDIIVADIGIHALAGKPCSTIDPLAPPEDGIVARCEHFDCVASYPLVPAGQAYTFLAVAADEASRVFAAGCIELPATLVGAGATLAIDLPVTDLEVVLRSLYRVYSDLNLAPLRARLLSLTPVWQTAACPLGAAQLIIDSMVETAGESNPLIQNLQANRGDLDEGGCRPSRLTDGSASLDGEIMAVLTATGNTDDEATSAASRLSRIASDLYSLFYRLTVESTMSIAMTAPTSGAPHVVQHHLDAIELTLRGNPHRVEVPASDRLVITATAPATRDGSALMVGSHGYTIALGQALASAFVELVLEPKGIDSPAQLGTAIHETAAVDDMSGCIAISAECCSRIGRSPSCLSTTCAFGVSKLNQTLFSLFSLFASNQIDFRWEGAATAADNDNDLLVDTLAGGIWSAQFLLTDGESVPVSGSFQAVAVW